LVQQPIAVDQYLLWTISEGGKPFDTAMPAFKADPKGDLANHRLFARWLSAG
jgi:hypothetical protein